MGSRLAFFPDVSANYDLIDDNQAGLMGTTFTPESDQIHFRLFTYAGTPKPAANAVRDYINAP